MFSMRGHGGVEMAFCYIYQSRIPEWTVKDKDAQISCDCDKCVVRLGGVVSEECAVNMCRQSPI